MLSWLLLILVIALVAVFGVWVSASLFGRGEALPPMDEPSDVIAANRAAVNDGRFGDIAIEVVPRGYRQDQVDALIEQLTGLNTASASASASASAGAQLDAPATGRHAAPSEITAQPVAGGLESKERRIVSDSSLDLSRRDATWQQ